MYGPRRYICQNIAAATVSPLVFRLFLGFQLLFQDLFSLSLRESALYTTLTYTTPTSVNLLGTSNVKVSPLS